MKEQTARRGTMVLDRPVRAALQRALTPALFVALALLVTSGYGSGLQLNDGQAALHINPLQFLARLLHAWNPAVGLGTHTGFWVPYQTPYSWAYGLAQVLHISQDFAQHAAVFAVYLGCLWSMYYCLRSVAPWLDEIACIAGSCAYLFNMYVALNSQAQIVWLLTYGTVPAMVGVMARAMRGETNAWRAALAVALLVLVGGGINPPLVAINVVILAIFVVVTIALDRNPARMAEHTLPIAVAAAVATLAVNLYWIVPFLDYFRDAWLGGVLTEAPSMHNAATSFVNVLRGLGHWATFVSFGNRAYFPWAAVYEGGLFGALLWFVPIVAIGGIAFARNQRPVALFFLIVTLVSVPLVVGYYHDQLGDAITTPFYDQLYRNLPGFQMFRFSYKWVAGVEFGISGLYALGIFAMIAALRGQIAKLGKAERVWSWLVPAARTVAVALPILIFVPVLIEKMNYPAADLPAWEYRENALVGADQRQRVALFPTQFLEQFDWGNPQFYIEDSLVDRPMVYGLLGSEPSEGSDLWVRRAYRATREGLPFAADMLRVLGVDTILQRDDFLPVIDFSSPGEWRFNSTTLTHDLLRRVVGASPVRSDGPLRTYHIRGALPLLYGVTHPVVSTLPSFSDAYLGDVDAMAKGLAQFDPPNRSIDEFATSMRTLSPVLPSAEAGVRDLAVNEALARGIRVHPPSADAAPLTPFVVRSGGVYAVFARDESLLFGRAAPQTLQIDGKSLFPQPAGGSWTQYGDVSLHVGSHWVSDGYLDPDLVVALVNSDDLRAWEGTIASLERALPKNLASTQLVYGPSASITVPAAGTYRLAAGAIGSYGPDGFVSTALKSRASRGAFPADLSSTLPYVFGIGVVGTSAIMMPSEWYRDDPTAYAWQRGDPMSWFLFSRDAHVRVYVSGHNGEDAKAAMRISRLQISNLMTVTVNGESAQSVTLPGLPAEPQQYDTVNGLEGPAPVAVTFAVRLRPGWNDLAFGFHPLAGERGDLGSSVISAAVAPDLSFQEIGPPHPGAQAAAADPAFAVVALPNPASGLLGDPEIIGNLSKSGENGAWLAVALARGTNVAYRIFPIGRDGALDANFMHAFANDWSDAQQRIVGLWVLARGANPSVSNFYYGVHAMPGRAMPRPDSLSAVPLSVDGRRVGAGPVLLSAGSHVVASADPAVKIGLLAVAPQSLPRTKDFAVSWERRSPTALDVTANAVANPFLLVFGEAYHPEWRATLDGETLPHVMVDGVANGWIVPSLPAGGRIVLTFVGQEYYVVADAISVVALVILIVLAWAPELWPIGKSSR